MQPSEPDGEVCSMRRSTRCDRGTAYVRRAHPSAVDLVGAAVLGRTRART